MVDVWNIFQQGITSPEGQDYLRSIPVFGESLGDMVGKYEIPLDAYLKKGPAEEKVRGMLNDSGSEQDQLDNLLNFSPDLATDDLKPSYMTDSGRTILKFYSDGTWKPAVGYADDFSDLPERTKYVTGDPVGKGTSGGPTALPIDYKYSPFVEPSLLDEAFGIEAVLQAGFLPAFRPGDLNEGIVAHPDRHATIRVMSIDKEVIYATTNFMMEGYNKVTKESFKIIESTLGNTLQLNKEKYKLFKMKLGVVDAEAPFDWLRSWEDKWDRYMRASVLAKNRWRWYILFGSHVIGGYPLQFSLGADAKDEPFTGISVDIFVTDDKPLPEMKRMVSEDGFVYFRWGGTTYNSDTLQFESTIKEFPTSAPKAMSPDEAEYERET